MATLKRSLTNWNQVRQPIQSVSSYLIVISDRGGIYLGEAARRKRNDPNNLVLSDTAEVPTYAVPTRQKTVLYHR